MYMMLDKVSYTVNMYSKTNTFITLFPPPLKKTNVVVVVVVGEKSVST